MIVVNWFWLAVGAVTASVGMWTFHTVSIRGHEAMWNAKYEEQRAELIGRCEENKHITEDNSREYENEMDVINSDLVALKRVRFGSASVPVPGATVVSVTEAPRNEHVKRNERSAEKLLDFAAECERYRVQVVSLQSFIDDVWNSGS